MKKLISMFLVIVIITLSGCSIFEEATDSLNYVNETTEYINDLSKFAEEAPSLSEAELKNELESLNGTIKDFIEIEPPALAVDLHEQIKDKSQVLLDTTNDVLESGDIAIEQLQQTEIFQTIGKITSLLDQIEQLGL